MVYTIPLEKIIYKITREFVCMALTDFEIEQILTKYDIKKDVYGFIKYSDEIVLESPK